MARHLQRRAPWVPRRRIARKNVARPTGNNVQPFAERRKGLKDGARGKGTWICPIAKASSKTRDVLLTGTIQKEHNMAGQKKNPNTVNKGLYQLRKSSMWGKVGNG